MNKKIILAYLVSLAFIVVLLTFFDVSKTIDTILTFNPLLFGLILVLNVLIFISKGIIWKLIVEPFEKISLSKSFYVLSVGFFANLFLPLRAGEFIRAYFLSKASSISKSVAFSTVIVNRVIETLFLVVAFFIGILAFPVISQEIKLLISLIGFLFFVLIMVFVFSQKIILLAKKYGVQRFFPKKVSQTLKNLISGGASLRNTRLVILILLHSAINVLLHVAVYYVGAIGFGLNLNLQQLFFILSLSTLSALIPSSPGYLGTFQAAFVASFVSLGLDAQTGLAMSIVLHVASYISTIGLGLYSTHKLGIEISKVFSQAKN